MRNSRLKDTCLLNKDDLTLLMYYTTTTYTRREQWRQQNTATCTADLGLYCTELYTGYVRLMLATMLNLIGVAIIIFWDVFLFEQSYICSTDSDSLYNNTSPSMSTIRLHCSDMSDFQENNILSTSSAVNYACPRAA